MWVSGRDDVPSVMLGTDMYLRFRMGYDPRIFNAARPKDVWIRAVSNMQNAYSGTPSFPLSPKNSCSLDRLPMLIVVVARSLCEIEC